MKKIMILVLAMLVVIFTALVPIANKNERNEEVLLTTGSGNSRDSPLGVNVKNRGLSADETNGKFYMQMTRTQDGVL